MSAWSALLISGLVVALILARAASAFFWEPKSKDADDSPQASAPPPNRLAQAALLLLVLASPVLTLAASPISAHARATAEQLRTPERYVEAVLGKEPQIDRERRP
jgi:multicomponent K+:H+ antiporter subunit D